MHPTIIIETDAHENPDSLSPHSQAIIKMARAEEAILVYGGDKLNLLPWGYDAWPGSRCLTQLKEALDDYYFVYVGGNHDPHRWVRRLLPARDWPMAHILRKWVYSDTSLGTLEVRHGHRWAVDWAILRYIAPSLVEFLADYSPQQWYWVCRQVGWLPSKRREESINMATTTPEKKKRYTQAILSVWVGATYHAERKNRRVICGHTHSQGGVDREGEYLVADAGTLKRNQYIRIEGGEIKLCNL